ncbi:TetR/AcrR family transcriptional regulator [Paenibacillus sp. Soil787]|uniref:TetR/AcrR family transcriptional regulator n=1 Tax=Paenibacillus sp. Soil787 TaxID=1736411 RepID=UPI0006F8E25B|nr:TetR/AcrR family transcriptional regulator [Paenibacillus sp. Soil787]KRF44101.1 TetR family transcriptional regulator [Paenibacillus sp. Soil787]
MKQEERRQQTTTLLLDSTKELIREKGCHSITMKDIMEKSGLSKGAIFHYVKSKDEIFAWVLQERLEVSNNRFMNEVDQDHPTFDNPMQKITASLSELEDGQEVTNKVLMYLLGKEDQPLVADVLKQYYERSVHVSKQWIMTGQEHGVIPESVDTDKTAEMFVLLSLGFRLRSSIPLTGTSFNTQDYSLFMRDMLKGKSSQ